MDENLGENYIPRRQSFCDGFLGPKGNVGYSMMFSMEKAREKVKLYPLEQIREVIGGLDGDFIENNCVIYNEDGWHEYDSWPGSIWATPIIIINFKDRPSQTFECWVKE